MKGTILSIDADGTETVREIIGKPKLDVLKEAIGGGYIEIVPAFNLFEHDGTVYNCVAFCDEEGKLKEQPFNRKATTRWWAMLLAQGLPPTVDVLVGKIAVVWGDEAFMRAL